MVTIPSHACRNSVSTLLNDDLQKCPDEKKTIKSFILKVFTLSLILQQGGRSLRNASIYSWIQNSKFNHDFIQWEVLPKLARVRLGILDGICVWEWKLLQFPWKLIRWQINFIANIELGLSVFWSLLYSQRKIAT